MGKQNQATGALATDVIIVGGGHNGLVAAIYLARAGRQVLLLEQNSHLGGVGSTLEMAPGYRVDTVLHNANMLRPRIVRELFLPMFGFTFAAPDPVRLALLPDGECLPLWRDPARTAGALRRFSPADATRWPAYVQMMERYTAFLEKALERVPPDLDEPGLADTAPWLPLAAELRLLGDRDMYELLRLLPMPVAELMAEWFEHPAVQAAVGLPGIWGSHRGPRAGGTAFMLLYHQLGHRAGGLAEAGIVAGGVGQLAQALAAAARHAGVAVELESRVERLWLEGEQVRGVVLAGGRTVAAPVVLSTANPFHTFRDLAPPSQLPLDFNRAVGNVRFQGALAKVNLALDGLPHFRGVEPAWLRGRLQIAPDLTYAERAADAAKYGRFSTAPVLELTIPTLHDPALAPPGQHTMSVLVQYAPYRLQGTTWAEQREALGDAVLNILADYAPDLSDRVRYRQVLTPLDLEDGYGLYQGSVYHGAMELDQLFFMRPVPGWARYHTPLAGLYLGGAGAHPGGGITGEPGRLAAQQILKATSVS